MLYYVIKMLSLNCMLSITGTHQESTLRAWGATKDEELGKIRGGASNFLWEEIGFLFWSLKEGSSLSFSSQKLWFKVVSTRM